MRRRGRLGQAVRGAYRHAGAALELLDHGHRDRGAAAVGLRERRQVAARERLVAQQGQVGRDRRDRDRRSVELDQPQRLRAVEAIGEHQRQRRAQREPHVGDQAGDVEQRGDPEHRVVLVDVQPFAEDARVVDEVPVGVHRALWRTRRARCVGQRRDVVRSERHGVGRRALVCGEQVQQVVRLRGGRSLHAGQQLRRRAVQQVELRRRDDEPDPGRRRRRGGRLVIERLEDDDPDRPAVGELPGQLTLAQHRVARHGDRPELPDREQPDRELRDVLEHQRDAVAALARQGRGGPRRARRRAGPPRRARTASRSSARGRRPVRPRATPRTSPARSGTRARSPPAGRRRRAPAREPAAELRPAPPG